MMRGRGLIAIAVLFLVAWAAPAWAAVSFNNSNTMFTGFDTLISGSQTVNSGSNLVAIAFVWWEDPATNVQTITYAGSAMTSIGSAVSFGGNRLLRAFYLVNPTVGSNTLSVTFTGAGAFSAGAVLQSYTGVDQSTPIRINTYTSYSGLTDTAGLRNLVVTSAANDLTVTNAMSGSPGTALTSNQTQRSSELPFGAVYVVIDDAPGAATVTHSWDAHFATEQHIAILGFSIQASGGSPDVTPPTVPTNVVATVQTSTTIGLAWTASTDAVGVAGYNVERCSGVGCAVFTGVATQTATNYNDSGLTQNTSYTYRVRAFDSAGNFSGYGTAAAVVTTAVATRNLAWTPVAPFTQDGFQIFRCVTTSSSCTPNTSTPYALVGPTATTYIDTLGGTPVSCYQVQATLGALFSGLSNIACNLLNPITLTITTAGTGTGSTIPTIGITTYASATVVNLTATPIVTSEFAGWTGDPDCADGFVTLNTPVSCIATFNSQQGTFSYLGNRGTAATRTLSNTISVTPTATVSQTNLLIVRAVTDNTSTSSGATSEHTSVTDTLGNQYVKLVEHTRSGGSAGDGVTTSLWASRPFASVTTVNSVRLTTATARVANSIELEEFRLAANTTFATDSIPNIGASGISVPGAVLSGLTNAFRLFVGNLGVEGPPTNTPIQSPNWASGTTTNGTVGGATTANVTSFFGFKRQTSTGDLWAPTLSTPANWTNVMAALATATAQNASSLTLTNSGTGGGTLTGAGTYYNGTNVTITATPNAQSQFVAWQTTSGDACASTTSNTIIVQLTQNTTCNAVFTLATPPPPVDYVLTLATAGTGTGTVSGGGTFASGTTVNITANPASTSTFDGWSPAICAPGTFVLNGNQTCTATFTLRPLATMTTVNAGTGAGTTSGSGTFFVGQTAVLTATPAVGSVFSGWSGSAGCVGTSSPLSVLMDASKTCTATYTVQTGSAPTGVITADPTRTCPIAYIVSVSTGGPVATVVWRIDGVTKRSSEKGVPVIQTVAPYRFTQTLVKNGSLVTADVTDTSGNIATFGPVSVSCP